MTILRTILNVFLVLLMIALSLFIDDRRKGYPTTLVHYYFADYDSSTVGTIFHSKLLHGKPYAKRFDIKYFYSVAGEYYTSTQVNFSANDRDAARILLSRYPEGKEVTVYYDSSKPMFAVLELTPLDFFSMWSSFFMAVVFGVVIYLILPFGISKYLFDKLDDLIVDIGSRPPAVKARTKYVYRISFGLRIVFIVFSGICVLVACGCIGDEPLPDVQKYLVISLFSILLLISILSPYKNSFIVIKDDSVTVPTLFIPPFAPRLVQYKDIVEMIAKTDRHYIGYLIIRTRSRKVKISGHFCVEKFRVFGVGPDEFFDVFDGIYEKYDNYKRNE